MIPLLIVQVAFSIGLGISLGVLNVFFRDVGQFFSVVIQFWFWLTPIVYPITILPEAVRAYLVYNPMLNLMVGYQDIIVAQRLPDWESMWPITLLAFGFCVFGMMIFRKRSGEMVDEL